MNRPQLHRLHLLTTLALAAGSSIAQCAPTIEGSLALTGQVGGVYVENGVAYVPTNGLGLVTIDVSNPSNPTLLGSVLVTGASDLFLKDDIIYHASGGNALTLIDVANPATPAVLGSVVLPSGFTRVVVSGTTAYVGVDGNTLQVVDVSVPATPTIVTTRPMTGTLARSIAISGTTLFVGGWIGSTGCVDVFDITAPQAPVLLTTVAVGGGAQAMAVEGDNLYIGACGTAPGLYAYDVSTPASPVLHAYLAASCPEDVIASGPRVYMADSAGGNFGLSVIDVTNPATPTLLGQLTTGALAVGVAIEAGQVYLTEWFVGLHTIDVETCAPPGDFINTDIAVGNTPCDVIAKDLTGDDENDIATADSGDDTVTVLTNDGSGGFGGAPITVALAAGSTPAALAAGDIIAGGGCDLAVAALDGDAVIIVDNNPAGTFAVSATLSTLPATEPVDVAVGKLNSGSPEDLVVAMQGDVLLPGTGGVAISIDGGALTSLTAPAGGFVRPQGVALCDLDGDGDNDIAVTMMGDAFSPSVTDNLLLYENDGIGGFGAPLLLSVAQNPRGIVCYDLDGDGDNDIAVTAESSPFLLPGTVVVFDNTGLTAGAWSAGSFVSGGTFTDGTLPSAIAAGELGDDSIPGYCELHDLVAVNFASEDLTRFNGYDGTADTFASQDELTAGAVPAAIAIADFNGDKTPDLVVANKGSANVTVMTDKNAALAKTFGTGCPGTAALVPSIAGIGAPEYGSVFGIQLADTRPFAPTIFALSLSRDETPFGPCTLYLGDPVITLLTLTNASGQGLIGLGIPNSGPFNGCDVFFQFASFDTNGAYAGVFAFSDALRTKLGN